MLARTHSPRPYRITTVPGVVLLLVSLAPLGCALNHTGAEEVATALARYRQDDPANAAGFATGTRASVPVATTPPGDDAALQTLRDYLVLALERNPDIRAAVAEARRRAARVPQVTALPDPMVSMKVSPEPTRTAEGDSFFMLGVRQTLPVPEKLDRRGRIALEETRIALADIEQTRLRVVADVKRAYFQLYVVDRTTELTNANRAIIERLIDVAQRRVAAARAGQQDALRAQVELSTLHTRLIDLRQRRASAAAMLNSLLDRPAATEVAVASAFDARTVDVELDRLVRLAVRANPELTALEHAVERDRQGIRLARLGYWPDFTLGFEWMQMDGRGAFKAPVNAATGMRPPTPQLSEAGSDNWSITLGFNLPIWFDRIEAGIREARHKLTASLSRYAASRNRLTFRVADSLERVHAQSELADLFRTVMIPQAEQAYVVSRDGYTVGTNDFQAVIDNWQRWYLFSTQHHRALGELERSIADLEQSIGLSLADLPTTHETPTSGGTP